ncbi:MAG: metal-dependent hydrolase [Halieaceae bacterium]
MDPVSQAVLGAAAPKSVAPPEHAGMACLLGALAGMAPDLDILIRSSTDPLLFLEYHRQFTHSLFFIPIGGFICGWLFYQLFAKRRGLSLRTSVLYSTLGYATHALLDACTTYGTQLLWPFTDQRFAWNTVSVIDPIFTLPLLVLVALSVWQRRATLARVALLWAIAYPSLGMIQRDRAEAAGWELARERGHQPLRLEAKPSFANVLLWKIVYETEDRYHVDAIRVGRDSRVYPGDSVRRLDTARDFPWLQADSQQAIDLERFRWFSNGYVAVDPRNPNRVTDIRYSLLPNQIAGLWSIELAADASPGAHVSYVASRDASDQVLGQFRIMLFE